MGVNGAHTCIPFQCETCWIRFFWKIVILRKETTRMKCVFIAPTLTPWMVRLSLQSNLTNVNSYKPSRTGKRIGKVPSLPPRGPFPLGDPIGTRLIIEMLVKFKSPTVREHIKEHIQFDTVQKLRSTFTKLYKSSHGRVAEDSPIRKRDWASPANIMPKPI